MWKSGHWIPIVCTLIMSMHINVAGATTPGWDSWLKLGPDAAQLDIQWDSKTQTPRAIRGPMATVQGNQKISDVVEQLARDFSSLMGLGSDAMSPSTVERWRGQTVYRFNQMLEGIPVEGHQLVIGAKANGDVVSLQNGLVVLQGGLGPRSIRPEQARELAKTGFKKDVMVPSEPVEVVLAHGTVPVRAYRVPVRGASGGMWFVFVRADDGRVVWIRDAAIH